MSSEESMPQLISQASSMVPAGGVEKLATTSQVQIVNNQLQLSVFHRYSIVIPPIITCLWRIELGMLWETHGNLCNMNTAPAKHDTYRLHKGSFGPFKEIIVKEAPKENIEAKNEVYMLTRVDTHPNFQQLRSVGQTETSLYVAVDECGKSLKHLLNIKQVALENFPLIYKQLLDGFQFLKKIGVLHRDVSCKNIYLADSAPTRLKIGGLKHAVNLANDNSESRRADIPFERLAYRYPDYGSNGYNWKTELFLVGCVMNSMLNGKIEVGTDKVEPTAPPQRHSNYLARCVLHLNKVIMSDELQQVDAHCHMLLTNHFLFWDLMKTYMFVCTCYDYLDGLRVKSERGEMEDRQAASDRLQELKASLEQDTSHLFRSTWQHKWLHRVSSPQVRRFLRQRSEDFSTVYSIIATLRCRGMYHYEDQDDVRAFFGAFPEKYMQNWLQMFPGLLSHMVRWTLDNELRQTSVFSSYFEHTSKLTSSCYYERIIWEIVKSVRLDDYEPVQLWC